MPDALLTVEGLNVFYGSTQAVRNASLSFGRGEIVCLIGANGAGKSSMLMGIMALCRTTGDVRLEGQSIASLATTARVARGLALVPEGRQVFPAMTVRQNLVLGCRDRDTGVMKRRLDEVLEAFPLLGERIAQPAGSLSGGEQQMLAIARALMSGPRALLLDEPTLGLAPIMVSRVADILKGLSASGLAILLAEQNLHMALSIADKGYVLETSRITLSGTARELRENADVAAAYLGIVA